MGAAHAPGVFEENEMIAMIAVKDLHKSTKVSESGAAARLA
jgi:hypothetical protein